MNAACSRMASMPRTATHGGHAVTVQSGSSQVGAADGEGAEPVRAVAGHPADIARMESIGDEWFGDVGELTDPEGSRDEVYVVGDWGERGDAAEDEVQPAIEEEAAVEHHPPSGQDLEVGGGSGMAKLDLASLLVDEVKLGVAADRLGALGQALQLRRQLAGLPAVVPVEQC